MRKIHLLLAWLPFLAATTGATKDIKLMSGVPVEFEVPSAPPSLAQRVRKNAEPVRMSIRLPENYDPARPVPVLLFLSGGDGGGGGEMHQAMPFLGSEGYVLCNMPLFKQNLEGETPDQQLSLTPLDGPYALPAFRLLLDELRRLVPNLDPARSIAAGFSNGANALALLLWTGDPDLLSLFSHFALIEGGFWLGTDVDSTTGVRFKRATFAALAGKRVCVAYGDQTSPPDRIPWIQDARTTIEALGNAGVAVTAQPMPGVGHDFPPQEMDKTRRWLLGK